MDGSSRRGFNGYPNPNLVAPCAHEPAGVTTKTIGLAPCTDCGSSHCWLHYLRWEVRAGVTLNEAHHHLVR